jgi:hypothetical protein
MTCQNATMSTAAPALRRRRLTFKRALLAVLLGLAAWWGVGRWLSPWTLCRLRYPDSISQQLPSEFSRFKVGGGHFKFWLGVDDKDTLIVQRPNVPDAGRVAFELIDLTTGNHLPTVVCEVQDCSNHPRAIQMELGVGRWTQFMSFRDVSGSGGQANTHLLDIPGSRQQVRREKSSLVSGSSITSWLRDGPWIWDRLCRDEVVIRDPDLDRSLWCVPVPERGATFVFLTKSGAFLGVHQEADGWHEVSVARVPMSSYSPWWCRSAGLLIAALSLIARLRRRA